MTDTQTTAPQFAMLPVDTIEPHPGNVRIHCEPSEELQESVNANGVRVPIMVSPLPGGKYQLIMGERRWRAATAAKRPTVPAVVVDPAEREAGQDFIDMIVENGDKLKESLTELEEADGLFKAIEAGMKPAEVAKRTNNAKAYVTDAAKVVKALGQQTRETLKTGDADWTLDELALLAEFDAEPEAVARLVAEHGKGFLTWQANRERARIKEEKARQARREELTSAGVRLLEDEEQIPETARWLHDLQDADGQEVTPEGHAGCPGHVATWDDTVAGADAVAYLCEDPQAHGHQEADDTAEDDDQDEDGSEAPVSSRPQEPSMAVKKEGNRDYRAATVTRREWLAAFLARKTAPKEVLPFVTKQLYVCGDSLSKWTGDTGRVAILAELRGKDKDTTADKRADWVEPSATPGRMHLHLLAVVAAAYEKRIEPANLWREDNPDWDTNARREEAAVWLTFLASLGYTLSPVEQAVNDGEVYDPTAIQRGMDEQTEAD